MANSVLFARVDCAMGETSASRNLGHKQLTTLAARPPPNISGGGGLEEVPPPLPLPVHLSLWTTDSLSSVSAFATLGLDHFRDKL